MTEDELIAEWHKARCNGTIMTDSEINPAHLVAVVLSKVFKKNPDYNVSIIVNDFDVGGKIIDQFKAVDSSLLGKLKEKRIKIRMLMYLQSRGNEVHPPLCILYKPDSYAVNAQYYYSKCKFHLTILSKLITNVEESAKLYNIAPLLNYVQPKIIKNEKPKSPVIEEHLVPIKLSDTDKPTLEKYNKYINESVAIFGDFGMLEKARKGDAATNTSAMSICENIAYANGWDAHLDMSSQYNIDIDGMYNPNSLFERAAATYEYVRKRQQFLADYETKRSEVLKIVEEHNHVLIINKRGEFAKNVTDFINTSYGCMACGDYHNNLEPIEAVDVNGNPIFYKSGSRFGQRKLMAAKAQMTLNNQLYNIGSLKALSANGAPNKDLCCNVDCVIITSPFCDTIEEYIDRLSKVSFNTNGIQLYTIYIKDSAEEVRLNKRKVSSTHKIVNKSENNVSYDENNDIVIVD